jgi:hypothetical protein
MGKFLSYELACRLRDAVRRKCPEKWRTKSGQFFPQDFLEKNHMTTLEHLSHLPDLISADFYPSTTEISTEGIFDTTEIIRNATE